MTTRAGMAILSVASGGRHNLDALIFLVAFAGVTMALWLLGAHGLAVAFAGIAVVVAVVEAIWYFRFRRTISQEVGRLWSASKVKFGKARLVGVLFLVSAGAVGLVLHLWAMRR